MNPFFLQFQDNTISITTSILKSSTTKTTDRKSRERKRVLLEMIAPKPFEGDGLSYWQLIGIPTTCSGSWFSIFVEVLQFGISYLQLPRQLSSTSNLECSGLQKLKKHFEVDQNLYNAGVFKGIEMVNESLTFS